MPRARKNDPAAMVTPLVEEFARKLGTTLERFITGRITKETKDSVRRGGRRGRPGKGRRRRARVTCYYPGCKNVAAPRFGMFCAALHKNIPKAEKEKYREQHLKAEGAADETPKVERRAKRGKR
jgi:hypothetical protein